MPIIHKRKLSVAAHRGDSYNEYENTMTAFAAAVAAGVDMIETDVRLTRDGVLVIMHDEKVDRTTNGCGAIADMTLDEVRALNAGDKNHPEKVPTFSEFIEWAKDQPITLNIEIKEYFYPGNKERCEKCVDDVLALVEKHGLGERILINSFDAYVLEYVYKKHGKKYMLHGFYPYSEMKNVNGDPAEYLYCACVFRDKKEYFDFLISRGIEPWIGAKVTQKKRLSLCIEYGAKLVTTNDPRDTIKKINEIEER